ncbi:hypothetical protein HYPSUDRAFT_200060 [Hypholoma sublateritium FD-334 SS-4]|uniref:Uncharacterized protein n=1 Tax=Hypholoma sublateritium (strain FD-334 SS-4) TaxID=945553 RepID=A0A0D2P2P5_HYPSF|nr:hypothetical protein HYPSUDRAFT_200060 [Hypholoma sublateritium FD-334 SS-4]
MIQELDSDTQPYLSLEDLLEKPLFCPDSFSSGISIGDSIETQSGREAEPFVAHPSPSGSRLESESVEANPSEEEEENDTWMDCDYTYTEETQSNSSMSVTTTEDVLDAPKRADVVWTKAYQVPTQARPCTTACAVLQIWRFRACAVRCAPLYTSVCFPRYEDHYARGESHAAPLPLRRFFVPFRPVSLRARTGDHRRLCREFDLRARWLSRHHEPYFFLPGQRTASGRGRRLEHF